MTRRAPLQTVALAVLVAALTCTIPATALAGQGYGKNQEDNGGHGRSKEQRQTPDDNRGNGRSQSGYPDHGRSDENRQSSDDYRGNGNNKAQQRQSRSPQDAAQQARSQYGGHVLKVQPAGRGYQVRLLQDDGRVVTVPIED